MTSNVSAVLRTPPRAPCATRWLRALIWLTCALALTSCGLGMMRTPAPTPIPATLLALLTPIPPVDHSLTEPCPRLPPAADDQVPTLIANHAEVSGTYHQCRGRHAGLAKATRERERLAAERIERARAALLGMRP